jgi:hypothetical protein
MTFYFVNLMWAIMLFGVLLWTTACCALNAALRRGMHLMGLVLSYGILVWMLIDLPWRVAVTTWSVFAVGGGLLTIVYELWARRRYAGTGRAPRRLIRLEGIVLWPALVPDAVGLMFNDAGILPADERSERVHDDALQITPRHS